MTPELRGQPSEQVTNSNVAHYFDFLREGEMRRFFFFFYSATTPEGNNRKVGLFK